MAYFLFITVLYSVNYCLCVEGVQVYSYLSQRTYI